MRRGPPFHSANFAKLLLYREAWCIMGMLLSAQVAHSMNLHSGISLQIEPHRAGENAGTHKPGKVEVRAVLLSEGCTVPPSGRSPPLQPHGQTSLSSSFVFRPVNCSILLLSYLAEETALSEKGKMRKRHQQMEKKKVPALTSTSLVSCNHTELRISKADLHTRNGFFFLPDTPFSPFPFTLIPLWQSIFTS